MQSNHRHQFNTMPKQAGFIASCWLSVNSLSYDRLPEIRRVQETMYS